jgi:hypothetical protein
MPSRRLLPISGSQLMRRTATVLLGVGGVMIALFFLSHPWATDMEAYWQAGERVRQGSELYPVTDPHLPTVYRYAPWFAWAWAPLTLLPKQLVMVTWTAVLLAASLYVVREWGLFVILAGPALAGAAWIGNVQPLMLALIIVAIKRGWAPAGIAVAASLKATPILLALYFVGRGQWRDFALTIVLTAFLLAPVVAYDLTGYVTDPAQTISLYGSLPLVWLMVGAGACLLAVATARSRYGWFTASVAVVACLPRMIFYDIGYLAISRGLRAGTSTVSPPAPPHRR